MYIRIILTLALLTTVAKQLNPGSTFLPSCGEKKNTSPDNA